MEVQNNRIVVEESKHSTLGASGAYRWLNCPGSIGLTARLVKQALIKYQTNRAAAEGSAAHLVFAACMEDGDDAEAMRGIEIEVDSWLFTVDDEMVRCVQEALDWCRDRISRAKTDGFEVEVYIEKGMSSFTDPDAYGTGDIIIHVVGDRLIIGDLKYGRGVTVEPDSDQNYYYCYLSLENYVEDPSTIKVIESWIFQPRIPHPDGTIRRHITNVEEVMNWWFDRALPGMEATRKEDAELVIGDWCRFCPNKGQCPALKAEVFEFPVGIDPSHLNDEELGQVIQKLDILVAAKPTFETEALMRARRGSKIAGRKLVRKKAIRVHKEKQAILNEDTGEMEEVTIVEAAEAAFGMDAYTEPKLKSPAQLEKLPGGNKFTAQWSVTPDAGLTMAPSSDKRVEVTPNVNLMYDKR